MEQEQTRSHTGAVIAIAAVIIVILVGGGMYAYLRYSSFSPQIQPVTRTASSSSLIAIHQFCNSGNEKPDPGFQNGYYYNIPIENADPATFQALPGEYAKDAAHVWRCSPQSCTALQGADPATFCYGKHYYAKDATHVWDQGVLLQGANPSKIQCVDSGCIYVKDDKHIWWYQHLVEGADPTTFTVIGRGNLGEHFAKDRNNIYEDNKIIQELHPSVCTTDSSTGCIVNTATSSSVYGFGYIKNISDQNGIYNITVAANKYVTGSSYPDGYTIEDLHQTKEFSVASSTLINVVGDEYTILTNATGYSNFTNVSGPGGVFSFRGLMTDLADNEHIWKDVSMNRIPWHFYFQNGKIIYIKQQYTP